MKFNPKKTALLIIDIQFDFCSPQGVSAKYGGGLTHMKKMLPRLKSFHKEIGKMGIPIFFTQYLNRKKNVPVNIKLLHDLSKLFPICVEGTKGAEIYYLTPTSKDRIIKKQYYDAFSGTDLLDQLKKRHIETLLITGVWTDMCVDATAKRSFGEGFNIIVLSDLVSTIDNRLDRQNVVLKDLDRYFGFVKSSKAVLTMMSEAQ